MGHLYESMLKEMRDSADFREFTLLGRSSS